MRTLRAAALAAMLLPVVVVSARAETIFPGAIARPNNRGDQVIAYYDVRDGFTTFINLRNEAVSELRVELLFYGTTFSTPFSHVLTLPAVPGTNGAPGVGGLVVLDVGALRANGLPADAGIAIATGIDETGQAIVTRGLSANSTVANLASGAAWGSPAAGRSAIHPPKAGADACEPKDPAPTLGTVVDGSSVLFTPIQPANAALAAYYDPATLAPAALGGNQLIFVSFVDVPGTKYTAAAAETHWTFTAVRNTGEGFAPSHFDASGVVVTDLASVIGPGVNGSSGAILFTADPRSAPLTRLIFFSETLGTFSTGYLLPRR